MEGGNQSRVPGPGASRRASVFCNCLTHILFLQIARFVMDNTRNFTIGDTSLQMQQQSVRALIALIVLPIFSVNSHLLFRVSSLLYQYVDPFTGASRYMPGSGAEPPKQPQQV